jgi:hypothetical protein
LSLSAAGRPDTAKAAIPPARMVIVSVLMLNSSFYLGY